MQEDESQQYQTEHEQNHAAQASSEPVQQPLPLAFINGEAVIEKPQDLYIPPDALEVILEAFEGPLDLLLYLIRKQKFDIVNLPILDVTKQYMEYVEVMKDIKLELAGEYLVMAAMLAEIKSRVLLPKRDNTDEEEDDPRAELIRRLKEYEVIKRASQELDAIPRQERDWHVANAAVPESCQALKSLPDITLQELVMSFQQAIQRASSFEHHQIHKEILSTRERMSNILTQIKLGEFTDFEHLFDVTEGKAGVVVTFLAVLELVKEKLVELVQVEPFSHIHVRVPESEMNSI